MDVQLCSTAAVTYAHDWSGHLRAEVCGGDLGNGRTMNLKQVIPRSRGGKGKMRRLDASLTVSLGLLVQHTAGSLVRHICDPDTSDLKTCMFGMTKHVNPKRLVQFLHVVV